MGVTNTFGTTNAILHAAEVTVNGIVTHQGDDRNVTTNEAGEWIIENWVYVDCSNLTVAASGKIDCYGKGFVAGRSGLNEAGHGPGAGGGSTSAGGGGGHGGVGGAGEGGVAGVVYDSTNAPVWPGSGGGCGPAGGTADGGKGGGLIRIVATGTVTINGSVAADAQYATNPGGNRGGGGSGGGIYITCRVLGGTNGLISANGGWGRAQAGGGGGGRIAVYCNSSAQSAAPRSRVLFSVSGKPAGVGTGQDGSVYVSDALLLPEAWLGNARIYNQRVWSGSSLLLSNAVVRFMEPAPQLTVTGDMLLFTSTLYVAGAPHTNASVQVTGAATLNAGSWIYPQITDARDTNALGAVFSFGGLTISSNSGFNADSAGWAGAQYAYNNAWNEQYGFGLGGGRYAGGGGGHGGTGGYANVTYGRTYGGSNAPAFPGSGGACAYFYTNQARFGGAGGGLIRIGVNGTFTLDGTLTANASGGSTYGSGGGSGGGIYVVCKTFSGAAYMTIRANGGNAPGGGYSGGGGRVAIWRRVDTKAGGTFTVAGGTGGNGGGQAGTFVWGDIPPSGGVFVVR